MTDSAPRRGDTVQIEGNYQYRATYAGYAPQRFWHQTRFRVSLAALAPQPGDRALDVGCGSGVFAAAVADTAGSVLGVDANAAAVAFARQTYRAANLTFELRGVDALTFPDQAFERISLLEVIEHIHPREGMALLATLRSALTAGGRLVVSTPNARSAWPFLEWSLDRLRLVPRLSGDQHVASYHGGSLRASAEAVGLRLVDSRTLFVVSPALAIVSGEVADRVATLEQRTSFGSLLVQTFTRD